MGAVADVTSLMVFYYAVGGGIGHLARAKKILAALSIVEFKVVTAHTDVARHLFTPSQLMCVPAEWATQPPRLTQALLDAFHEFLPERLIVDTFPTGIVGELDCHRLPSWLVVDYVARYLDWSVYAPLLGGNLPQGFEFERALIVDRMHPEQAHFVVTRARQTQTVNLPELSDSTNSALSNDIPTLGDKDWLIVHSVCLDELEQLFLFACEQAALERVQARMVVLTSMPKAELSAMFHHPNVWVATHFPASELFQHAGRIFTACGFNAMLETEPYSYKHHFIPFPRRYDDQFLRARWRRESTQPALKELPTSF